MATQPLKKLSPRYAARPASLIGVPPRAEAVCLELEDHSVKRYSAVNFFQLRRQRDPQPQAARMLEQFTRQNRALMSHLDVRIDRDYDGTDVTLLIRSGSAVGAVPLFSPITARLDYGLVVQPRFAWAGIGPMLAEMGWRVSPRPLRLPLLHRSERRVPPWVLSTMILVRLQALLECLNRRFEAINEIRRAPRGRVDWNQYATKSVPRANLLSLPCSFVDLRDDRLLKGAIRHTLEQQIRGLETQKEHGAFIHKLLEFAQQLLVKVRSVPLYVPLPSIIGSWMQRPMRAGQFVDGLQAIEWTIEERGLAGVSDLEGIPWTMPMDKFFEAWVETVFRVIARRTGARLKVARKRETIQPISWDPPYLGSQKSLIPDIWLEWDSTTLIIDAKYKRHWEEMKDHRWSDIEEQVREEHRNDLFQVLAYANLAHTARVIVCLAYPCSPENWYSLTERGRVLHKAEISVGSQSLHLWLTAVPMDTAVEKIAEPLGRAVKSALR